MVVHTCDRYMVDSTGYDIRIFHVACYNASRVFCIFFYALT